MLIVRQGATRPVFFFFFFFSWWCLQRVVRKSLIMLPEWRDGQGWSRFAGNLSKVMDFLEATVVSMGKMKG